MEIYIEDVFITNFVADFAILFCMLRLSGIKTDVKRIAFSSIIGAVFSLIPTKEYFVGFSLLIKFFEGLIMLIPLKIKRKKLFVCWLTLFIVSFSMLGILLGISLLIKESGLIKSTDIYFLYDLYPFFSLAFSGVSMLLLTSLTVRKVKRMKIIKNWMCEVNVQFEDGKSLSLNAFIDSGNLIYDDKNAIAMPVFNYFAIASYLKNPSFEKLPEIDVKIAGGMSKLKRIKIEKLVIKKDRLEYKYTDIPACVSLTGFSEDFDVLLSPELLTNVC